MHEVSSVESQVEGKVGDNLGADASDLTEILKGTVVERLQDGRSGYTGVSYKINLYVRQKRVMDEVLSRFKPSSDLSCSTTGRGTHLDSSVGGDRPLRLGGGSNGLGLVNEKGVVEEALLGFGRGRCATAGGVHGGDPNRGSRHSSSHVVVHGGVGSDLCKISGWCDKTDWSALGAYTVHTRTTSGTQMLDKSCFLLLRGGWLATHRSENCCTSVENIA